MNRWMLWAALGATLFLAGLTAAIRPAIATGHDGGASITCTSVTFSYSGFANYSTPNTVSENVTVDGSSVYSDTFSFGGSSGSHAVAISVPQDGADHEVVASASWNTNGHEGSFSEQATVNCGQDETQPPTETPPPGPPHVCPDGLPPDAGKDGEPGNDDCARPPSLEEILAPKPSPPTTETTPAPTTPEVTTEPAPTTTPKPANPVAKPPVGAPTPPKTTPQGKKFCPNGTPMIKGKCHAIVRGSG